MLLLSESCRCSPLLLPLCLSSKLKHKFTTQPELLVPGCLQILKVIANTLPKCFIFGFLRDGRWARPPSAFSGDPVGSPLSLGRVQEKAGGHLAAMWLQTGQGAELACSLFSSLVRHGGWCLCLLVDLGGQPAGPFPTRGAGWGGDCRFGCLLTPCCFTPLLFIGCRYSHYPLYLGRTYVNPSAVWPCWCFTSMDYTDSCAAYCRAGVGKSMYKFCLVFFFFSCCSYSFPFSLKKISKHPCRGVLFPLLFILCLEDF